MTHIQNNIIKQHVTRMLHFLNTEIDVSAYDATNYGIGYNELRYLSVNCSGQLYFESNNIHDWTKGEDVYKKFTWQELTDYEKKTIECTLQDICWRYITQ